MKPPFHNFEKTIKEEKTRETKNPTLIKKCTQNNFYYRIKLACLHC